MTINTTFTFRDGRTIQRIGFGAMRLTGQPANYGPYADWEAGKALLRRAAALGVEHFDTARAYGPGYNERLIADAFGQHLDQLFIATKGGVSKSGPGAEFIKADGRPESLSAHIEQSLEDLNVEQIDLYYLHRPDAAVPIEDSIGALAEAKAQGKIARVGVSNVSLAQLHRAESVTSIDAVQNRYNPKDGGDDEILDYTTANGIAFVPWGPLGANPLAQGSPLAQFSTGANALSGAQLALYELLDRAPNVLPIPGTTTLAHLEENVATGARLQQSA